MTGQMIALDGGQHLAWQTPDIADVVEWCSAQGGAALWTCRTPNWMTRHRRAAGEGRSGHFRSPGSISKPTIMRAGPAPKSPQRAGQASAQCAGVYRMMNAAGDVLLVGRPAA